MLPKENQSVYEFNKERFYSIATTATFVDISARTIRKRIENNKIYHSKINDRTFFKEWQIVMYNADSSGEECVDCYTVEFEVTKLSFSSRKEYQDLHKWTFYNTFDSNERDRLVQAGLETSGDIRIKKTFNNIDLMLSHYKVELPDSPSLVDEMLISTQGWCKYILGKEQLTFSEYENHSVSYSYVPMKKFKKIKKDFLQKENKWEVPDLYKYISHKNVTTLAKPLEMDRIVGLPW